MSIIIIISTSVEQVLSVKNIIIQNPLSLDLFWNVSCDIGLMLKRLTFGANFSVNSSQIHTKVYI